MSDERADLTLEMPEAGPAGLVDSKQELSALSLRMAVLEDDFRSTLSPLYSIQADVARLKDRMDRIEQRLGLRDTEH
jgi:hypothetical protein